MLTDDLLALQGVDSAIDQLGHRRSRLPERNAASAARDELAASRRRAGAINARNAELEAAIEAAEHTGAELAKQRARLEAQLRTVIAPREAEALMAELATIAARRDVLDDAELEHLDEQTRLAGELAEVDAARPALDEAAATSSEVLRRAEAEIDQEIAALQQRRGEIVARLDGSVLADYESRRQHHGGVAVASLDGRRCSGCNLDLSTSELEAVRATPPGAPTECPQCGRILVP